MLRLRLEHSVLPRGGVREICGLTTPMIFWGSPSPPREDYGTTPSASTIIQTEQNSEPDISEFTADRRPARTFSSRPPTTRRATGANSCWPLVIRCRATQHRNDSSLCDVRNQPDACSLTPLEFSSTFRLGFSDKLYAGHRCSRWPPQRRLPSAKLAPIFHEASAGCCTECPILDAIRPRRCARIACGVCVFVSNILFCPGAGFVKYAGYPLQRHIRSVSIPR